MQTGLDRSTFLRKCAAVAGAAATSTVPRLAGAADLQTVRLSMAAMTTLYSPYMIAIEKGYYAQEGLQMDIKVAGGGISTPAQIAGTIDINTSGPVAIPPILRGASLKIVYTEATHSAYQLWSTSPDIKSLKDLKGMQVGVISRGDTFELATKLALLKAGLPLDWVNYTALGGANTMAPAFVAKSLPAVVLSNVEVEQAKRVNGFKNTNLLVNMMRDLPMPYSGVCVTDAYLRDHADNVRGFLRATMKGVRYMKTFKPQTMAIVQKYNANVDPTILTVDYDETIPILTKDGTVPDDVLRADLEVHAQMMDIPKSQVPPLSKAYDYTFVREVNAQLDRTRWKPQA